MKLSTWRQFIRGGKGLLSKNNSVRDTTSPSVQHLSIISKRDNWETPFNLFNTACVDYRIKPLLDVCALRANKKCDVYLGPDHSIDVMRDALTFQWKVDFFMNPPYSRITQFMDYAFDQIWEHRVSALMLTYAKTDTEWWHRHIENNPLVRLHFIKGRLQFLLNGIVPLTCANKDCKAFYDMLVTECVKCGGTKFTKNSSPYPSVWIVVKMPMRNRR